MLIPVLVFAIVGIAGSIVLLLGNKDRKALNERLEQIKGEGAFAEAVADEKPNALTDLLERIGGLSVLGGPCPKLKATLARAGHNQRGAPELFFGIKISSMVIGLSLGLLIAIQMRVSMGMGVLVVVGAAAVISMIPNLILGQKVKKRTQEIRHALPNAIDLLEVCVSAGMGMDQAWNSTSEEMGEASQALADEMQLVNLEMLLGAKRSDALKSMADRSGADDLANLSSIISQADKFGTSVADALRTFAETMREARSQKAEESAEKMAIKLLLPMVIFIFPVVLVVSAGPAAIKMVELLSN